PARAVRELLAPTVSTAHLRAALSGLPAGRCEVVGLELPVEVAPLDAEPLGGPRHVPVVDLELREDVRPLEVLPRVPERPFARFADGRGGPRAERRRQVVGSDHVAGGHDHEALHHVAKLADVSGPVVGDEVAKRLARAALGALAGLAAAVVDE